MATALDSIRRQIARLEKITPNSRLLKDLRDQLAAFESDPDQSAEAMYYSGNPVVPTSRPAKDESNLPAVNEMDQLPDKEGD